MSLPDKIKNKKGIVIAVIALIAVAIGGGATLAYFSSTTAQAHNEFKGAAVNISVIENEAQLDQNNKESEDETGNGNVATFSSVSNGTQVPKIVRIKNKDTNDYHTVDTYVRVRLVPKLVYDDNNTEGYAGQTAVDLKPDEVTYTFADNLDATWDAQTVSANGKNQTYYYYKEAIRPGELSSVLLTAVQYNGTIPQGQHFELEVLTEGIAAGQHSMTVTETDPETGVVTEKEVRADYMTAWNEVLGKK